MWNIYRNMRYVHIIEHKGGSWNFWQIVFAPIGGKPNFFQRTAKHAFSTNTKYSTGLEFKSLVYVHCSMYILVTKVCDLQKK